MILHAHQTLGRFLLIVFLAATVVASGAQSAEAKPSKKEEASQRFQKGVELYDAGDLRAALIEFRRAYELLPTYQLLYNMGQAAAELKDYAEAYEYYRLYLRKGRDKIDDTRIREVEEQIEQLEGYLASIDIRVVQDDAEVSIDGVVVGVSPIDEALKVSAGRRKVVVSLKGYLPFERKLDLAGRDAEVLDVDLISLSSRAKNEDAPNPFLEPGPGEGGPKRYSRAFWTSATITGLLAAGTGFFAIQTYRARNIYDEQLALVPNSAANIRLAGDDLRQFALLTDISLGLTVVGVISTVLFAGRDDDRRSRAAGLQMQISPSSVAFGGRS